MQAVIHTATPGVKRAWEFMRTRWFRACTFSLLWGALIGINITAHQAWWRMTIAVTIWAVLWLSVLLSRESPGTRTVYVAEFPSALDAAPVIFADAEDAEAWAAKMSEHVTVTSMKVRGS